MVQPLIFVELNEINFDMVQKYIAQGYLPTFKQLLDKHPLIYTEADLPYEQLEPWIQWVSARTGLDYPEHQVFHLGDIIGRTDIKQHWEVLEEKGYSTAAISPINAENRTQNSPFWMPDPWVETHTSGKNWLKKLANAIQQAVNDNAKEKLKRSTKNTLLPTFLTKSQKKHWPFYCKQALQGIFKGYHWPKAIFLDQLISDIFRKKWLKYKPDFATIFLNGGAHIQHHYWFNSQMYEGSKRNPSWYISQDADPVLDVYKAYDQVMSDLTQLDARIMIGTGLQQVPYEEVTFYYRLTDHASFLQKAGVDFKDVSPRMSRDFLITCDNAEQAKAGEDTLRQLTSNDGTPLFKLTDRQGNTVFVTLTYPHEITSPSPVKDIEGNIVIDDLYQETAFVALKNGHHDKTGYLIDTQLDKSKDGSKTIAVEELYQRVMEHFA